MAMSATPFSHSCWVEEGRLLAGQYPGSPDPREAETKLAALVDCGVRAVVSLIEADEKSRGGVPFVPYEETLRAATLFAAQPSPQTDAQCAMVGRWGEGE
jgi:hypothetical protein